MHLPLFYFKDNLALISFLETSLPAAVRSAIRQMPQGCPDGTGSWQLDTMLSLALSSSGECRVCGS